MTIENQVDGQVEGAGEEQVAQPSPIEAKAMEMGWRPIEEFEGDEVDFVDAKEFVGRKALYDKIGHQNKQIKNITQSFEALKGHISKAQEAAYKKALNDLKDQRDEAIELGDATKFRKLDDGIKDVEREFSEIQKDLDDAVVKEEPVLHPEFVNWQARNPWYGSTDYMRAFADKLGARLANTMSPSEVLKEVEKEVRKEFPNKFSNPNKADAPDTTTSRAGGRSSKSSDYQMNEQEERIWKTLHRTDPVAFSKENYIKQLKGIK